ncbi:hypothetical protein [Methylobacterium nodulans]|uniref:Uncharacterized protein n=1 Tax=Methylobacterium nodulans (strain LMG 21967 / CNCM I-2342 / ORS 2060) TaxID=460265 RepID=B8IPR5_METNO|nr:hypothetical protein [Methylobacterium nodulans]ACL56565.1 conserved hypothetical protein [Methylobacterium nodulans ORS 2060]
MQKPIAHQHADGSAHYSYCHPEDILGMPRFEWTASRRAKRLGQRSRTALRLFGSAFALATAAFWATMLVSPPTSEATAVTEPAAHCAQIEQAVRPWFDREVGRRARLHVSAGLTDFNTMLLWYRSAHTQCMSGKVRDAENNLRRLETMITALADRYAPQDEY